VIQGDSGDGSDGGGGNGGDAGGAGSGGGGGSAVTPQTLPPNASMHLNTDGSSTAEIPNGDGTVDRITFDQNGNVIREESHVPPSSASSDGDTGVAPSLGDGTPLDAQGSATGDEIRGAEANRPSTPQGPGDETGKGSGGNGGSGNSGGSGGGGASSSPSNPPPPPGRPSAFPQDFNDPTQPPGPDWQWRPSTNQPGTKGNWANTTTKESWHPDLGHGPPDGPHWDYVLRGYAGKWKWYPDGTMQWVPYR
jgi:hypothetical protein